MGPWDGAGHPSGGARGLRRDAADQDEDKVGGVFAQLPWLQRDLFGGADDQRRVISGRRWSGDKGDARQVGD